MYPQDPRLNAIHAWLTQQLMLDVQHLTVASSDASFRRYFRVTHQAGRHIVMDAPPDKENTAPFIRIAALLRQAGLNTPRIHAQNLEQGFLLLDDFGQQSLLDALNPQTADELYQVALDSLLCLQTQVALQDGDLPDYDRALLLRELGIFYEWFLDKTLKLTLPSGLRESLETLLLDSALAQPQVCVHRDYHSRNLMWLTDSTVGIIDFQDAVRGPISYDLVSLLRDCYIDWTDETIERWLEAYWQRLVAAAMVACDFDTFRRWFDLMGLQRHLKAIGIFSRLHWRDNKSNYLADIPRTLNYVAQVSSRYAELAEFNHFLHTQIFPAYAK